MAVMCIAAGINIFFGVEVSLQLFAFKWKGIVYWWIGHHNMYCFVCFNCTMLSLLLLTCFYIVVQISKACKRRQENMESVENQKMWATMVCMYFDKSDLVHNNIRALCTV